jgi:hypothetical protein
MNEKEPTTSSNLSLEGVSRVDLNPMNGMSHGFRLSAEGKGHGGVFVGKERAGELAQSYFHADELRAAMESQGLPAEQIAEIFASATDKSRVHISEMANSRSPHGNDRSISVFDGKQNKIGGGAEFHGKTEAKHSKGEYIDVDLSSVINLKAAIIELQEPAPAEVATAETTEMETASEQSTTKIEAKDETEAQAERVKPRRRLFRKLTAAALIGISLFGGSLASSGNNAGPIHRDVVAAAPGTSFEGPQTLQVPENVDAPDVQRDNYTVTEAPDTADWTINPGDGGDALFNRVGIGIDKWNQIAPQLYQTYETGDNRRGYFYMEGNDVRFDHAGEVPADIEQTIKELVAQTEQTPQG